MMQVEEHYDEDWIWGLFTARGYGSMQTHQTDAKSRRSKDGSALNEVWIWLADGK